jgi:ethanolamine ammonia-lyase small subunit
MLPRESFPKKTSNDCLDVAKNAASFLRELRARLLAARWSVAPPAIVLQGRVAVGDEVGELLGANIVVVQIGERPGLRATLAIGYSVTGHPPLRLAEPTSRHGTADGTVKIPVVRYENI